MGGLLRLVRDHQRARAEERALSEMSSAELHVAFCRSLAELPPAVDQAGFIAIARTFAVKRSPGPPCEWPRDAIELLREAGIGEFLEEDMRDIERSAAYYEFCKIFDARRSPETEPDCGDFLYRMREAMIQAGAGSGPRQ
jgi:hypothetical protein